MDTIYEYKYNSQMISMLPTHARTWQ